MSPSGHPPFLCAVTADAADLKRHGAGPVPLLGLSSQWVTIAISVSFVRVTFRSFGAAMLKMMSANIGVPLRVTMAFELVTH